MTFWSQKELQNGPKINQKQEKTMPQSAARFWSQKRADENRKPITVKIPRPVDIQETTVKPEDF